MTKNKEFYLKTGYRTKRNYQKKKLAQPRSTLTNIEQPLAITEMQTETSLRLLLIYVRIPKISNTNNRSCWQGCGARDTLLHCCWEGKLIQALWKSILCFLRKLGIGLLQDLKLARFLWTEGGIKNMWYINTTDYYLPLKKLLKKFTEIDGTRKKSSLRVVAKIQKYKMACFHL